MMTKNKEKWISVPIRPSTYAKIVKYVRTKQAEGDRKIKIGQAISDCLDKTF